MKKELDDLFWWFEKEKFVYKKIYPYQTELVFAFADFVENANDETLQELMPDFSSEDVRKTVRSGTEKWLKLHAKTMMLL